MTETKDMKPERLNVSVSLGETACSLYDIDLDKYYHDPKLICEVEKNTYEDFGADGVGTTIGLHGMAEAFGSIVRYQPKQLRYTQTPLLTRIEELSKLRVPDPEKDGLLPVVLEALDRINTELKGKTAIACSVAGPITVALNLCGAENILKWLRKFPKEVHEIMAIITEANNLFIDEIHKRGASIGFADPVASVTVISYQQFKDYALPYLAENVRYAAKISGEAPSLHICGKSKQIWDDLADCGIGAFSVDNCEDLHDLREAVGERIHIVGNVPPVEVIMKGTKEDIDRSIKDCILKGYDSPKGYSIAAGCQIPYGTPRENIAYYVERSKELGKLPIDVERLRSDN